MSIKYSLLALLSAGPNYGYQLKAEFEERTASTWSLNIGQVYTTLDRLERDELVARHGEDASGRIRYQITAAGQSQIDRWFSTATQPTQTRDELVVKLALAVTLPGVNVPALIQAQRHTAMLLLQDLTRARRDSRDVAWKLVIESRIFHTEAELRWLDHCESAVLQGLKPHPVASLPISAEARK